MKRMLLFGAAMMLAGCATGPKQSASTRPVAECLVCKMNVDLACVDVDVDSATPTAVYDGKTYYFCSAECREKFLKEPKRYVGLGVRK